MPRTSVVKKFPKQVRDTIDDMLNEGHTYKDVVEYIDSIGYKASSYQVEKYWKFVEELFHKEELLQRMFEKFTDVMGIEHITMDRAITRVALNMIWEALMVVPKVDLTQAITFEQLALIIRTMERIRTVDVQMGKWQDDMSVRAKEVSRDLGDVARQHGIPSDVINRIRSEILSIPYVESPVDVEIEHVI